MYVNFPRKCAENAQISSIRASTRNLKGLMHVLHGENIPLESILCRSFTCGKLYSLGGIIKAIEIKEADNNYISPV